MGLAATTAEADTGVRVAGALAVDADLAGGLSRDELLLLQQVGFHRLAGLANHALAGVNRAGVSVDGRLQFAVPLLCREIGRAHV